MSERRWPIVTFFLVAVSIVIFLQTSSMVQSESPELRAAKEHVLSFAATHPELEIPDEARDMVQDYQRSHPEEWQVPSPLTESDPDTLSRSELQSEMNTRADDYAAIYKSSFLAKYAFIPRHTTPVSYVSAIFLHISWGQLLFNLCFLCLAGMLLEDIWGHIPFAIFYVLGGVVGFLSHSIVHPASPVPVLGGTAAVSALMGAFFVRFAVTRITFVGWFVRVFRFRVPAIALSPFWLVPGIVFGFLWNRHVPVAHVAHVGGFVFGAIAALALRFTPIERKVDEATLEKIDSVLPETFDAQQLMSEGEFNAAEIAIKDILEQNPASTDALRLLQQVYWRKTDIPQYQETTLALCQACLKARDTGAAWQAYEEFLNSGGQSMNPACWVDVTRLAEETQRYDRAVDECEKLIATYPNTREALMAQIRAGRICQKQLVLPQKALAFFEAAYSSPVPHLDLEQVIATGIRECKAAATMAGTTRG